MSSVVMGLSDESASLSLTFKELFFTSMYPTDCGGTRNSNAAYSVIWLVGQYSFSMAVFVGGASKMESPSA
jgi:hypothetical protein